MPVQRAWAWVCVWGATREGQTGSHGAGGIEGEAGGLELASREGAEVEVEVVEAQAQVRGGRG